MYPRLEERDSHLKIPSGIKKGKLTKSWLSLVKGSGRGGRVNTGSRRPTTLKRASFSGERQGGLHIRLARSESRECSHEQTRCARWSRVCGAPREVPVPGRAARGLGGREATPCWCPAPPPPTPRAAVDCFTCLVCGGVCELFSCLKHLRRSGLLDL